MRAIKILFVEDLAPDVEAAQRELKREKIEFSARVVDTEKGMRKELAEFQPDLIISDYSMPRFDGMSALKIARFEPNNIPFIVLTGSMNEETAVACMKAGADDYVLKEKIRRLPFAVREVMDKRTAQEEKERLLRQIHASEKRFRTIMSSMQDIVFTLDMEQRHTAVYGPWVEQAGMTPEDFLGKTAREIMGAANATVHEEANAKALEGEFVVYEWSAETEQGTRYYQTSLSPIVDDNGEVSGLVGIGRDITQIKQAEQALRESEEKYRLIVENANDGIEITQNDRIIFCNTRFAEMLGYTVDELQNVPFSQIFTEEATRELKRRQKLREAGKPGYHQYESTFWKKDGTIIDVAVNYEITDYNGRPATFAIIRDITEHKQNENLKTLQYKIAYAAVEAKNATEFHEMIWNSLGELMDVENFYVAFFDEKNKRFSAAFEKDEKDQIPEWPADKSMTGQVIRQQKSLLLKKADILKLADKDEIELIGSVPEIWLGVPFRVGGKLAGVLVSQNYDDPNALRRYELEILEMLSAEFGKFLEIRSARDALRESEATLQAILHSTADGILAIGKADNVLYVNDRFAEMWRIPAALLESRLDSLLLQHVIDQLADPEGFLEKVRKLYDSDVESFDTIFFKDGRVFERLSRPLFKEEELCGRVWSFRDITERKQAEHDLIASEKRYRRLFESAKDGILILDADSGMVVEANPFLIEMLGYSHEQFMGKRVWELGPLQDIIPNRDNFLKLQQQQYIRYEDMPLESAAGKLIHVEFVINVYLVDNQRVIQCNIRDITQRKQTEEALRVSEERFRVAQEFSPDGFTILHPLRNEKSEIVDFTWVYENQTIARINGTDPEDVVGKRLLDIFPDHKGTTVFEAYIQVVNSRKPQILEEVYVGEIISVPAWLRLVIVPMSKDIAILAQDITERKQAEKRLERSEKLYRTLFSDSQSPIFMVDEKSRSYVDANQAALNFMECSKEELVGRSVYEYTPPDKLKQTKKEHAEFSESKTLETDYLVNGKIKTLLLEITPLKIDHSDLLIGIGLDITKRKQAEDALKTSEEKFRSLFYEHSAIKLILDPKNGNIVEANKAAAKFYGWTVEELEQMNISQINTLPPEKVAEEMERARQEKNIHFEFRHRKADGSVSDVEVFSSKIDIGGKEYLHSIIHDISDKKKAERQIRLLSRSIEQNPVMIVITDADGNIEYVNPAFTKTTGYAAEEVIGKNPRILQSGEHQKEFYTQLWDTILSGKIWEGEFCDKNKDGEMYWEDATISPILNEQEEITHFVGIKEDITKRKQMEAEKEALEFQLQQSQKLESIGTLASGVAHDFNNLLTVIMGHAQMGLMNTDEDDPLNRSLKQILTASTSAANLTRQLLLFSRKEVMEFKPVNINQTIQKLLKMLGRLIGENIKIETSLEPDVWMIEADEGNLEQVLTNLAVNARDAMPDGGKLTIQTENVQITEADKKHILNAEVGNYVRIGIIDNGTGIPEDIRDKIFDPFFTTKASGRGTGLGLSGVYGIVKKHGGWINVYSEVGKGTRFTIYLPAAGKMVQTGEKEAVPDLESLQGNGERILLIEDEESVLEFTLNALRQYEYKVFPVSTGKEARTVFEQESGKFDLIFSDVILPDTNGYELVQNLTGGKPDIPIILSSGYTDERVREQIGQDASITFIQKPYSILKMLEMVKIALQKSQIN